MSRQMDLVGLAGVVIDSLEFSRDGRSIAGDLAVDSLDRLAEVVVEPSGTLHCELRGERRHDGKPALVLEVSGCLRLRCERCLGVVEFPLRIFRRLLLVPPGETWPEDEEADDDWDAIEASREQSVPALVEDEVLLALPIVPRHEVCELPLATQDEQKPSPFAVLAKIKRSFRAG